MDWLMIRRWKESLRMLPGLMKKLTKKAKKLDTIRINRFEINGGMFYTRIATEVYRNGWKAKNIPI